MRSCDQRLVRQEPFDLSHKSVEPLAFGHFAAIAAEVMGVIHDDLGELVFSSAALILAGLVGLIRVSGERVYK